MYCHMDNTLENSAKYLALNLSTLRKKRGLSQAQLAARSDLPRSTISHFESGTGNPSLQNLIKLSASLQISIEELLSAPHSDIRITKSDKVPVQVRQNGQAQIYKLLPANLTGTEFDRIELTTNGRMAGVPHLDGTKEFFICQEGEIQISVSGQKFLLASGDVLSFQGNQPHSYVNKGKTKAIGFSVVFAAHGI